MLSKNIFIIFLILCFASCSELESFVDSLEEEVAEPVNDTVDDAIDDVEGSPPKEEPACPNPIVSGVQSFSNGTLWKPEAEGGGPAFSGNPVFLAESKFSTRFDSCEVKLKNGKTSQLTCIDDQAWTGTPFSCFHNGGRQHWRFSVPCEEIKNVKVKCFDACQEVVFSAGSNKTCNRFE